MGRALKERLKQGRDFPDAAAEATVNLLLASAWIEGEIEQKLQAVGLTHAQFNVLRILRGAEPHGHPRCEIATRLIVRAPDVTRLVDRLVDAGLVTRDRDGSDRRHSVARITAAGLELLARADRALEPVHVAVKERLGLRRAADLSKLCEALWAGDAG